MNLAGDNGGLRGLVQRTSLVVEMVVGLRIGGMSFWSHSRRSRSRRHLLDVIRQESGLTRADLSLLTGLSRSAIAEGVQPPVDGVRESISRFTQPATAQAVDIRPAQLGLRSELLGAVAVAAQEALYLT